MTNSPKPSPRYSGAAPAAAIDPQLLQQLSNAADGLDSASQVMSWFDAISTALLHELDQEKPALHQIRTLAELARYLSQDFDNTFDCLAEKVRP